MQKWPVELISNEQLFEWRHMFWNAVEEFPSRSIVVNLNGKPQIECDSITAIMAYMMDEPYWDTEDNEVIKLNMRLLLALKVEKAIEQPISIRLGAFVLSNEKSLASINVLNERTMIADLIKLGWVTVLERKDSFMIRGNTIKKRRWASCKDCAHRDLNDGFCEVYRVVRDELSPVGVCCIDFYQSSEGKSNVDYVSISENDIYVPGYTTVIPDQEMAIMIE